MVFQKQKASLNLTIEKMMQDTGLSRATFSNLSKKRFRAYTLQQIANCLHITVGELLGESAVSATSILQKMSDGFKGSAKCCGFLVGDISVLLTKKALVFPAEARVHVSVSRLPSGTPSSVTAYCRGGSGSWGKDPIGNDLPAKLDSLLQSERFRTAYPWCPDSVRVVAASEVPFGVSLYEETALSVALARALAQMQVSNILTTFEIQRLAANLLSVWYSDVAWPTIVAASQEGEVPKLIWFDRTEDTVDLVGLYQASDHEGGVGNSVHPDFERNVHPDVKFWSDETYENWLSRMSLWWSEEALIAPIDGRERDATKLVNAARGSEHPIYYAVSEIIELVKPRGERDDNRLGLLMHMHNAALGDIGFVDFKTQQLLNRVNGIEGVLGAKLACGRGSGAILVFTTHPINRIPSVTKALSECGLRPLAKYTTPLDI